MAVAVGWGGARPPARSSHLTGCLTSRRPAPAPGGRGRPVRGPGRGLAPGRVGHGVRRLLEHQERPRRVPPPGLRPRAGGPGAQPLRPGLGTHPAGQRALRGHRGCSGALRPPGLGSTRLPAPGGRGRGLCRYRAPAPPRRARPAVFPRHSSGQIHHRRQCEDGEAPDSGITRGYLLHKCRRKCFNRTGSGF